MSIQDTAEPRPPRSTPADGVDLRHLRYALQAAELQSFAKASARLGIKQATLSRHISYLERRFGTALFRRSPRGVVPTEAGQVFLQSARRVLDEMEGLYEKTRAVSEGRDGKLAIGFLSSISAGNLRSTLFAFQDQFPLIETHCVEKERSRLLMKLETGALDALIVSCSAVDAHIEQMRLWSDQVHVALPRDHPLAARERVFWSDLHGETIYAPKITADYMLPIVQKYLAQPGIEPKVSVCDISREAVLAAVGAGRAVTFTTGGALGVKMDNVVLRPLFDGAGTHVLNFSAYWRRDNRNPALRTFLDYLRKRYSLALPED